MAKKFPTSLEDENEPNHVPAQTPERPIPHSREDRCKLELKFGFLDKFNFCSF